MNQMILTYDGTVAVGFDVFTFAGQPVATAAPLESTEIIENVDVGGSSTPTVTVGGIVDDPE